MSAYSAGYAAWGEYRSSRRMPQPAVSDVPSATRNSEPPLASGHIVATNGHSARGDGLGVLGVLGVADGLAVGLGVGGEVGAAEGDCVGIAVVDGEGLVVPPAQPARTATRSAASSDQA